MKKIKKKNQKKKQQAKAFNPKLLIAGIAAVALVVTLLVVLLSPNPFAPDTDFTVYDASGKQVNLSDYAGKPIVLNFWASWCGPCKAEMPDFQKAYEKYGSEVQFLMVNLSSSNQETQDKAEDFLESQGYSFPVLFDLDGDAALAYGVESIPTTYFFDKSGKIVDSYNRMIDEATLEKCIAKIRK